MKQSEIIKVVGGAIVFFGTVLLYVGEFKYITNTIGIGQLLLKFGIFLLLISGIVVAFIQRGLESLFEKFMLTIGCIVISLLLTPLLASFSNRLFGAQETQWKSFELISISERSEQMFGVIDSTLVETDGYRVQVEGETRPLSFYVRNPASLRRQDRLISLPFRHGAWGHAYLSEEPLRKEE